MTFGVRELYGGLDFVTLAVAMFGLAEIIRNLEHRHSESWSPVMSRGFGSSGRTSRRIVPSVLRGHDSPGSLLGVLPRGGHVLAAPLSYSLEKRVSRRPQMFRAGCDRGRRRTRGLGQQRSGPDVRSSPLLTLGLPAHPVMALLVRAFIIQGITPGLNVIDDEPELFWGLIASMWVGNLLLVVLNLPLIGMWVRISASPTRSCFRRHRVRLDRRHYTRLNAWEPPDRRAWATPGPADPMGL